MNRLLLPIGLAMTAAPAFAHTYPVAHSSFTAGLFHPLLGTDHMLAMLAVGLWAGLLGERALWKVPAAFLALLVAGFGLSIAGVALPFVEPMIIASVLVLGLLLAAAVRCDVRISSTLVGLFALFHGHAHGSELGQSGAMGFGVGFLMATSILLFLGASLAVGMKRISPRLSVGTVPIVRAIGGAMAFAGLGFILA